MTKRLNVAFLPQLLVEEEIEGCDVIVTDVLRASTTIISSLKNGVRCVVPCATIEEAHETKRKLGPSALLGGERGGVIIAGFDAGNSPREFPSERVAGRTLVLCTTNGTVAMERCRKANRVFVGAFVNLSAIVEKIAGSSSVTILCAGTDRRVTSEDVLFAGAVAERLLELDAELELSDQAALARDAWRQAVLRLSSGERLASILGMGSGGRNLLRLGYDADIEFCADVDRFETVPMLNLDEWIIV